MNGNDQGGHVWCPRTFKADLSYLSCILHVQTEASVRMCGMSWLTQLCTTPLHFDLVQKRRKPWKSEHRAKWLPVTHQTQRLIASLNMLKLSNRRSLTVTPTNNIQQSTWTANAHPLLICSGIWVLSPHVQNGQKNYTARLSPNKSAPSMSSVFKRSRRIVRIVQRVACASVRNRSNPPGHSNTPATFKGECMRTYSHHSMWQNVRDIIWRQLLIPHTSSWYPWPNRAFRRWLLPKQRNRPPTWKPSNGDPVVRRAAHALIWSCQMFGVFGEINTSLGWASWAWWAMWSQQQQQQQQQQSAPELKSRHVLSVTLIFAFPCNIQNMAKLWGDCDGSQVDMRSEICRPCCWETPTHPTRVDSPPERLADVDGARLHLTAHQKFHSLRRGEDVREWT